MGFLWNSKYSMASVYTSVHSMVAGSGCINRIVPELKKYKKVFAFQRIESETNIQNLLSNQHLYIISSNFNAAFLY